MNVTNLDTKEQMNEVIQRLQFLDKGSEEYSQLWGDIAVRYRNYIYSVIGNSRHRDDIYQEICLKMPDWFDRYESEQGDFHSYFSACLRFYVSRYHNGGHDVIKHNKQHMREQHKKIEEGAAHRTKAPVDLQVFALNEDLDSRKYNSKIESEVFLDECWDKIKHVKHADLWWNSRVWGNSPAEIMEDTGLTRPAMDKRIIMSGNSIVPILKEVFTEFGDFKEERKEKHILSEKEMEEIKAQYVPYKRGFKSLAKQYDTTVDVVFNLIHGKTLKGE